MSTRQLETTRIQEIGQLHGEIISHLKTSLEKAIRIGELLTEQKASLKHGEFAPWIEGNLPFTDRTARNYMRLHREKDRLKTETVSDLKSAYKLLESSKQVNSDEDYGFQWPPDDWRRTIRNINKYIGIKKHFISTDEKWFAEFLNREWPDDKSMTQDEMISFALWVNFIRHICFYKNYVWHNGRKSLPRNIIRYFKSIDIDLKIYNHKKPEIPGWCGYEWPRFNEKQI